MEQLQIEGIKNIFPIKFTLNGRKDRGDLLDTPQLSQRSYGDHQTTARNSLLAALPR
jgi:hypothetical protein